MRLLFPPPRLAAAILLLALSGCGNSKNEAYIEKPVDDLYNKAMDALVDERYSEAAKTFEQVESQHPYSAWATKSQMMGVYSLYENGNYDQAIIAADRFIQLHPGNRDVAYAYYLKAICYYMQITDVGRDQKITELALKSLDDVVRRFPDSKYARDAKLKLDFTRDHLAGKEMEIGRYYLNRGEYLAAMNRFKRVIENFQTTTHVPEALERLGMHVEMLDGVALAFSDLSRFNAIVVGVRAYELRHDLPGANQRLLDYVSNGGTLVVQYERDFAWDRAQYAPYPAKIGPPAGSPLPRITDENSPVKFLRLDDQLLNTPNKITLEDFKGWVQERGLYYWTQFDPKYTAVLAMNDPGEPDQNGGLVYARYGKGTYIYTGIAFFRQLPEGVPGAYRLFVNLLSSSQPGHSSSSAR